MVLWEWSGKHSPRKSMGNSGRSLDIELLGQDADLLFNRSVDGRSTPSPLSFRKTPDQFFESNKFGVPLFFHPGWQIGTS